MTPETETPETPSRRKPLVALVGRPNVGKSTLYNALTRSRDSLVSDTPGLTRDRNYGEAKLADLPCRIVDTGGLLREEEDQIDRRVDKQARAAVAEADVVVFVVDGRDGLTAVDEAIASELRRSQKRAILAQLKTDFAAHDPQLADFSALAMPDTRDIAPGPHRSLQQMTQRYQTRLVPAHSAPRL